MSAPAADTQAARLSEDSPWPGLAAYSEAAQDYFLGRETEIRELLARVLDEPLTVLFGRSGLGKSSLLMAGLFPRLRDKGLLPIYLRLIIGPDAAHLLDQVRHTFEAALRDGKVEYPAFKPAESLWEYLHRADLEFWTEDNRLVRPVFVFDQFEEVFTLGRQVPAAVEQFRTDVADLIENRIPAALAPRLEGVTASELGLNPQAMPYKILLSLREDFLADLESWRPWLPSLRRNRMRLLPMRAARALDAILNDHTRHLMDAGLADKIVAFLSGRATSAGAGTTTTAAAEVEVSALEGEANVDPALLSLFCTGINERRKRAGKTRFDDAMVEQAKERVVADFYRECLDGQPEQARMFIEDKLITEQGFRNSYAVADALAQKYLDSGQIDLLVNRRLLRRDHYLGTDRIELTHDLLTKAVMSERDRRREGERLLETARQRRSTVAWAAGSAVIALVAIVGAFWLIQSANHARDSAQAQRSQALSRQFAAIARRELPRDPDLAMLLGLHALKHADTPEARAALMESARYTWPSALLSDGKELVGLPVAVAVNSAGDRLAVLTRQDDLSNLSLWQIKERTPRQEWSARLVQRDAQHVVFSRDATQLAVGGMNGLELIDAATGQSQPPIPESGGVKAIAYGADGTIAWAGKEYVRVLKPGPDARPESIALDDTLELGFDREGRLLAAVLDSKSQPAAFLLAQDAGQPWHAERMTLNCPAKPSVSVGGGRLSMTTMSTTCLFAASEEKPSGANASKRESSYQNVTSDQGEPISDVIWSRVGAARVLVREDRDIIVKGPNLAPWTIDLRGIGVPAAPELGNEISLSSSGLRLAVLKAPASVRIYYLDRRPFFADLQPGLFAVAQDGSWLALVRQADWRGQIDIVNVFTLDQKRGQLSNLQTVEFSGRVGRMVTSGDTLIVTMVDVHKKETTSGIRIHVSGQPAWTAAGAIQQELGDAHEMLVLKEESADKVTYRVVKAADGVVVVEGSRAVLRDWIERTRAAQSGASGSPVGPKAKYEVQRPVGPTGFPEVIDSEGKRLGLPPLSGRTDWKFSDDGRWVAFRDDRLVEIIELEQRRHIAKLEFERQITDVFFEGGGTVLGVATERNPMLIPLGLKWLEAFAASIGLRKLSDSERCTYLNENCENVKVPDSAKR